MKDKRLSVRIEDAKTGKVREFKTNNLLFLTSDEKASEDKTNHSVLIVLTGNSSERYGLLKCYDDSRETLANRVEFYIMKRMHELLGGIGIFDEDDEAE